MVIRVIEMIQEISRFLKIRLPALVAALLLVLTLVPAVPVAASVTITPASGGDSISADTYSTGTWTSLGKITIAEVAKDDFKQNYTLTLSIPSGFIFNSNQTPSISYVSGKDLNSANITSITSSAITLSFKANNKNNIDTIYIGATTSIQVRPTSGTSLASGNIYCSSINKVVTGITTGSSGTNFGTLTEVAGAATKLAFSTQPGGAVAGSYLSPQPAVTAQDQFGNTVTSSSVSITLAIGNNPSGGTLSGTKTAAASSGTATFTDLSIDTAGTGYTLIAASGSLTSSTSDSFNITAPAKSTSNTVISSSNKSADPDETVILTVTVSGNAGTPTGTIDLYIDGILTNFTYTLSSGTVSIDITSNLSAGTHEIQAVYSGNTQYESSSDTFSQTVNSASTAVENSVTMVARKVQIDENPSYDDGVLTLNLSVPYDDPDKPPLVQQTIQVKSRNYKED